jgi:hypothetical protein
VPRLTLAAEQEQLLGGQTDAAGTAVSASAASAAGTRPSAWSRSPARAARSRRSRCVGGRRERGLPAATPGRAATRRHRCTVARLMALPSTSCSCSVRCTSLNPAYVVRASARTRSRVVPARRLGAARPRLPWTSAAGPRASSDRTRRRTWRGERPSASAASVWVQVPLSTRVRTWARRCARARITISSSRLPSMPPTTATAPRGQNR